MKAYFIGIGGIGVSALARYYSVQGWEVSGYDRVSTTLTKKLESEGLTIGYSQDTQEVPLDADLYVRTAAIQEDQPIMRYLLAHGKKVFKRSEILGRLSREYRTIAVAGTHGKTTTSSMLVHILKRAGVELTAFVGGLMRGYDTNYFVGKGEWLVVEADEYDRSFLELDPELIIWTSCDADHLDIYGDADKMLESYHEFLGRMSSDGRLIHAQGLPVPESLRSLSISYGEGGAYRVSNVTREAEAWSFDLAGLEGKWKVQWQWPGTYNAMNATAALVAAKWMGVPVEQGVQSLKTFRGIERRFESLGSSDRHQVVMDYAHHPQEIKAVIQGVKMTKDGRHLSVIFQPHLYTRTRDFAKEFAESLDLADTVRVTEIYPAREEAIPGVNTHTILKWMKTKDAESIRLTEIVDKIEDLPDGWVLLLGAGDMDKYKEQIKNKLNS